ncbi:SGNH hydrolase-type esterase domain-containing protein [Clohesyomyces aquaticus]|uniref:SGNH hydrolase-type esterase domain-containing protein n=1 Tax=Clohesyomyces aquaticus TaxID=1231657 RepID=A0A1Y1ZHC0_9PLEO|nr:SGNH hydrolase-type esterase domain-containing protein [Clohesyomyces aquaticus]
MVKITPLAAIGLVGLAGQAAAATVKIMPFGASIVGAPGCWRAILWKKLQGAGITNTDFVGSQKATDCGFPYDGENEGHAGFQATGIVADNQLPGWLSAAKPDIMMIHLGTNDVIQRKSTADTINAYSTLVDQMRASKPTMKILFSQLIPIDPKKFSGAQQGIIDLNKAIATWAPTKSTSQSPIVVIDNFTGFNVTTDTVDGEHPNDSGNQKLANKFYQPLVNAIKSVSTRRQ